MNSLTLTCCVCFIICYSCCSLFALKRRGEERVSEREREMEFSDIKRRFDEFLEHVVSDTTLSVLL